MTGISCALAGAASSGGGGGAALNASVSFSSGSGPYNVSGASSDLYTQAGGVISVNPTGGTPPYVTETTSIQGDASGKISIVAASDGIHNTVGYSGFSVNEQEIFYIQYKVKDSAGATVTARYPVNAATVISLKRTS